MLNWLKAQKLISSNRRRKELRLQDQMDNTNNIKMRKNKKNWWKIEVKNTCIIANIVKSKTCKDAQFSWKKKQKKTWISIQLKQKIENGEQK